MSGISWARAFGTGLLGKARAPFHGLGPKGEHPSREERCELCRFWQTDNYGGVGGPNCNGSASNCRRHAPQHIKTDGRVSANVEWVTTGRNDWCGDFEPR